MSPSACQLLSLLYIDIHLQGKKKKTNTKPLHLQISSQNSGKKPKQYQKSKADQLHIVRVSEDLRGILDWKTENSKNSKAGTYSKVTEFQMKVGKKKNKQQLSSLTQMLPSCSRQICSTKKSISEKRHKSAQQHILRNMALPKYNSSGLSTLRTVHGHSKFQLIHTCNVFSLRT